MSKTPLLTEELAKSMFASGKEDLVKAAKKAYPLLFQKITDKVKSFEDACLLVGEDPNHPKWHSEDPTDLPFIDFRKCTVIAKALNEGWLPDWNNSNEYKYYPWFDMRSSGGGFSFYDYGYDYSFSGVGSRLCFKSAELAEYAGKHFLDLYKSWMVISK